MTCVSKLRFFSAALGFQRGRSLLRARSLSCLAALVLLGGCGTQAVATDFDAAPDAALLDGSADAAGQPPPAVPRPWIDTHTHPVGLHSSCTSQACADAVVATMDAYGVKRVIMLHPPSPANPSSLSGEAIVRNAAALRSDRFFFGAGGNELNSRIQASAGTPVTEAMRDEFLAKAQALKMGAVSFGEVAALHLSMEAAHPFEEISPSSQLFFDLADFAATEKRVVELHMDTVSQTKSTPAFFTQKSANNPAQIHGNTDAFAELLAHNRSARFVWAHVGRDTTFDLAPTLVDAMLAANANLYIQVHATYAPLKSTNSIVDENLVLRAEWLALLTKYPERAVIGSDSFFTGTDSDAKPFDMAQKFLQQLPSDLAKKIGCENPVAIYGLSSGC